MRPEERDAAYLWDMREAARDIVSWVRDCGYEQFCKDELLHSAVERKLEFFGEAATRVSTAVQDANQDLPWKEIKGIRNILAHKYGDIDLRVIWEAAVNELPAFLSKIEEMMAGFEGQ